MSGIERIAKERQRQIEVEGWTPEHDARHADYALQQAARCYAKVGLQYRANQAMPWEWPWAEKWWKPSTDKIRNLEKAGALIAAEIDRLEREGKGERKERG